MIRGRWCKRCRQPAERPTERKPITCMSCGGVVPSDGFVVEGVRADFRGGRIVRTVETKHACSKVCAEIGLSNIEERLRIGKYAPGGKP